MINSELKRLKLKRLLDKDNLFLANSVLNSDFCPEEHYLVVVNLNSALNKDILRKIEQQTTTHYCHINDIITPEEAEIAADACGLDSVEDYMDIFDEITMQEVFCEIELVSVDDLNEEILDQLLNNWSNIQVFK